MKNKIAPIAGLFACFIFYLSIIITAYAYIGRQGESYNILNHFISDLGDSRISAYHFIFNKGLILAGIGFGIFAYDARGLINTKLANISIVIGIIASVLCSGVGVYPTDQGMIHFVIAISFFILMTLALTLYSICIWLNPNKPFPRYIALYGFCSPVAFLIFILMPKELLGIEDQEGIFFNRPDFWGLAFWEWVVFFFLTSWVMMVSVYMIRNKINH